LEPDFQRTFDRMLNLNSIYQIVTFSVVVVLAGCATVIDPSRTTQVDASKHISLATTFTYTWQLGGMCSAKIQYALAPGDYVSRFKNDDGLFFQSPSGALETKVLSNDCDHSTVGTGLKIDAGIFVPNNPQNAARIYYTQPLHGTYDLTVTSVATGDGNSSTGSNEEHVTVTVPKAPPVAAGLGGGIGAGIVNGVIVAEHGKIRILPGQKDDALARTIEIR